MILQELLSGTLQELLFGILQHLIKGIPMGNPGLNYWRKSRMVFLEVFLYEIPGEMAGISFLRYLQRGFRCNLPSQTFYVIFRMKFQRWNLEQSPDEILESKPKWRHKKKLIMTLKFKLS